MADNSHCPSLSRYPNDSRFFTEAGRLTRYALSLGYIERKGDDESGARMEQISSNGAIRVCGDGRWIRGEATSLHRTLASARKAFDSLDHAAISARIAAEHFASKES